MSNERRLEETAATLDDVKNTLDEVIDNEPNHAGPLEKAKESVDDALDTIEANLQGDDLTDD
jgi:hypothetical protein